VADLRADVACRTVFGRNNDEAPVAWAAYPRDRLRHRASLVLQCRCADIISSDLHPLAESFLAENLILNQITALQFHRCSWTLTLPEFGRFDLIIGSDLLYEPEPPQLLAGFIDRHATAIVKVIIVDPGRGNHGKFNQAMAKLGFHQKREWSDLQSIRTTMKKGHLLNYHRAS
jgi:hypothetical protein